MQEGTVPAPELAARVQQLAKRWAAQVDEGLAGAAALTEREYRRACRELRDRRQVSAIAATSAAANEESEAPPAPGETEASDPKPRRESPRPVRQPTLPPSIDGPEFELPDALEAMEWARAIGLVGSRTSGAPNGGGR